MIIGLGAMLAAAHAVLTRPFQAPDEPAHVNYAVSLARQGRLPVIQPGDWNPARVAQFMPLEADVSSSARAIDDMSYEDHQPPLYYVLGWWPATWANNSWMRLACLAGPTGVVENLIVPCRAIAVMRVMRGLSVLLALLTVAVAWRALASAFPRRTDVSTGATAFIAFLPMNAYMSGMVNNDALSQLVMALALLAAVRRLAGRVGRRRYAVEAGMVWGVALLTKLTVYPAIVPLAAAEALRTRREGGRWRDAAAPAAGMAGLGLAIGAPWFARNMAVYGLADPFGLAAHDRVVVGQPRTVDWIAQHGWIGYLERAVVFTFDSFWGVFGWMGAFMDRRIYAVLAVASVAMTIGCAGYLRRAWRAGRDGRGGREVRGVVGARGADATVGDAGAVDAAAERAGDVGPLQRDAVVVLGLVVATTVAGFVWYNLSFVQHQGRYLFPALVPIACGAMLGLREWGRWLSRAIGRPAWADGIAAAAISAFDAGLLATSIWALARVIPTLWPAG